MANITNTLNEFKTALNGESVRDAFVETMTRVNVDVETLSNQIDLLEGTIAELMMILGGMQ